MHINLDPAFVGFTALHLIAYFQAPLAQNLNRLFHIAIGLHEDIFSLFHARAGALA